MNRIEILKAMQEGRARFWPAEDALVIVRPGRPIRVFRKGDGEYNDACALVDSDLATQECASLTSRYVPLTATDKGKRVLARAPRHHGRRRNGTKVAHTAQGGSQ